MKTKIFYYSGTGNSLFVSKKLSEELGNAQVVSISKSDYIIDDNIEVVGFVFPVHIWGVPRKVVEFIENFKIKENVYYFAIAVNAGQVANTLVQFKKILKSRKIKIGSGFEISMPSNYIPWGGPGPVEKQQIKFDNAIKKVKEISRVLHQKKKLPVEKGSLWQNIFFTLLYKMSYKKVPKLDENFWVDDKCNSCNICEKVCPAKNIKMTEGKPEWCNHCEQCLACIQWCPQQAIQYGKKTPEYKRYHNPYVKLKDMIKD